MKRIACLTVACAILLAHHANTDEIPYVELKGHTGPVTSAVFSPDGKRVVTAENGTARIWNAESGKELLKLEDHANYVFSATFSPDGTKVVTNNPDQIIRICDTESGNVLRKLEGHTDHIYSVAFAPDGKKIVTVGRDKTVRIWDTETGSVECLFSGIFYVLTG